MKWILYILLSLFPLFLTTNRRSMKNSIPRLNMLYGTFGEELLQFWHFTSWLYFSIINNWCTAYYRVVIISMQIICVFQKPNRGIIIRKSLYLHYQNYPLGIWLLTIFDVLHLHGESSILRGLVVWKCQILEHTIHIQLTYNYAK